MPNTQRTKSISSIPKIAVSLLSLWLMLFCVDCAYSAQVTLTWDANTEAGLGGYKIYYGHYSRAYEHSVDVHNQTNCTLTDLEDGETYYFAATAYDIYGNESAFSEEVTWTSPPCQWTSHRVKRAYSLSVMPFYHIYSPRQWTSHRDRRGGYQSLLAAYFIR